MEETFYCFFVDWSSTAHIVASKCCSFASNLIALGIPKVPKNLIISIKGEKAGDRL